MSKRSHDDVLRELAQTSQGSDTGERPSDEQLEAFAAGTLAEDDRREMAAILSRSATARQRLAELVGVDAPSNEVRERIFPQASAPTSSRRHWIAIGGLAAAMVLVAVLLVVPRPSSGLESLDFDVHTSGAQTSRGDASDEQVAVTSQTLVRISVEPKQSGRPGLVYSIYVQDADGYRRLDQGVDVEDRRGSALLSVPAATLARQPGKQEFLVVVSESVPPATLSDAKEATRRGFLVYPQRVTLLRDPPG